MVLPPKGKCRPLAPDAKRPCRRWKPRGARSLPKCGARFSIWNRQTKSCESETKNVQTADESLEIAKANLAAGLGTQLDVLQAAADVTRTRTTRLSAIYLHNVALARLARACGSRPEALDFGSNAKKEQGQDAKQRVLDLAHPPAKVEWPMKSTRIAS